jgi:hypothetical protein
MFGLTIVMSFVVTGRDFGGVFVGLVADLAIFFGSCVVDVVSDGLTFAAMSDARVCAPPFSGADRSYLWMSSVRVCAMPSPVREVSCRSGADRSYLWFFVRGLSRCALS